MLTLTARVEEMKRRPAYQSKVMRGVGRLEDQEKATNDNKRKAYRDDVKLELERARLIYESYKETEGLPFVMVEAQTAGLPCVISDRVPTACVLVNELVSVVPLSVCAEDWAAQIQTLMDVPRTSCAQIVADSGFDIFRTSSWLTNYYCSLSRSL